MALTPEERKAQRVGFTMPEGTDLISAGDDAIRKNATTTITLVESPTGPQITADLVEAHDTRLPKWIDTADWSHVFVDRDGYVAAGIDRNANFVVLRSPNFPAGSVTTEVLGAGTGSIDNTTDWSSVFVDQDGRVAWGLRNDGRVFTANPLPSAPSRTALVCIGDSLVRGYTNSTVWDLSEAFPALMEQHLPGVEIVNYGFGGNTVDEVAIRIPTIDLRLSVDGGSIPASGPVPVTIEQKFSHGPAGTFTQFGAINGIFGNLTYNGSSWEFSRQTAGDPVSVPGTVVYEVVRDGYSHATAIVWCGRNDLNTQDTGAHSDMVSHVVNGFDQLLSYQSADLDHFLVVGPMNQTDEIPGTPGYEQAVAINAALSQRFPGQYINVREWFVHQAIHDLGMTPTAADLEAMDNDAPPPSLTDGGSHYIKPVAPLLAEMFATALKERGYL